MKCSIKYVFSLLALVLVASMPCFGQKNDKSNLVISGHGWYGYDIEQSRPELKSYGYMTYEAAVGFQTDPSDKCAYAQAFGFPMRL